MRTGTIVDVTASDRERLAAIAADRRWGGLLVSQVLTLFTTPVVYLYMDKLSHWIGGQRRSRGVPAAAE